MSKKSHESEDAPFIAEQEAASKVAEISDHEMVKIAQQKSSPCKMWRDGLHQYMTGTMRYEGGGEKFAPIADPDMVSVKRCICGAVVSLGPPA